MSFSPHADIREVLRRRPRAVEVFEISTGEEFWNYLDRTLADLCADQSLAIEVLLHRLDSLPPAARDVDFEKAPLYELADHLADDHRRYREAELPRLEKLIASTDPQELPEGYPLETLRARFHAFKIDFLLHMNEEEDFLIPKVLRTEGSVRHPGISPEVFTGSVGVFPGKMLHTPEAEIKAILSDLRTLTAAPGEGTPASERIRGHLDDLCDDIARHADLETAVLLPRTLALERVLKYREHSGGR